MSLLQSVREWLDEVFAEDTATNEVDEKYLKRRDLAYIETSPDEHPDKIRCDLCARLFDTMDNCVEHVMEHDKQGSASVDPFRVSRMSGSDTKYETDEPQAEYFAYDSEKSEVKNR
jgi:hypothetical protein